MKKLLSAIIILALLSTILVGCDEKDNSPINLKNITEFKGKETKLIPDLNATGELTITTSFIGDGLESDSIVTDPTYIAVEKYKELYPNVEIKVNRMSYLEQDSNYYQKFSAEVMAGKGPDIFINSSFHNEFDVYKMAMSGALADLTDYFANDENFNINDYNKNVFYGSQILGKQYIVPINYSLPTLLTTKELIELSGFDQSKCGNYFDMYNELNRIETLYRDGKIPCSSASEVILMATANFPFYSGIDWIDYENKLVKLDNPEIKQILELYKKTYYPFTKETLKPAKPVDELKNKECVLEFNNFLKTLINDYQRLTKDNTPIMLTWRDINGKIQADVCQYLAVNNSCKNKENAYRFIKVYLSNDVQCYKKEYKGNVYREDQFFIPISNQAVKLFLEYQINKNKNESYLITGLGKDEKSIAEEFVNEFMSYLSQTGLNNFNSNQCEKILQTEMEPYLEDKKTYEECIKQAKEKIEIYLSE